MIPTTTNLESYQDTVATVARDVFSTMLDIEPWPVEAPPLSSAYHPVVGAIYFAGGWKGAVLLECAAEQAYTFTKKLMSIETPTAVNDDVRDSMGEITNMIAGNLKSVLPPGTALSMPSVVEGRDFTLRVIGSNESFRMAFDSSRGPFSLTLVQVIEK